MEKFKLFLKDKGHLFLKKSDIEKYFEEFKSLWNLDIPFEKVMDSMRKTSLTYLFDNYWAISKDNPLKLSYKFLTFLGINSYYGLDSALYFNRIIWQPQLEYTLLNTKYTKTRKINGTVIKFIKIPSSLYNNQTLIFDELVYSNYEKTILDMIFFKSQKFYEPNDFEKINLYLPLYSKHSHVRIDLIKKLSFKNKGLIK
jgi:hypothetical protein